ncbi:MAG: PKD domain-containing protein, partial [Candidatus Latescibacterota bacterium]
YNGSTTRPLAPGNYTVQVTSTDPNYVGTSTLNYAISTPPAPTAALSASSTGGPVPLTVTFTGSETGYVDSRSLSTGDGGSLGSANGGSHTYTSAGLYTATYTVTGPGGTATAQVVIDVAGPPAPAAIAGASAEEDQPLVLNLSGVDSQVGTWSVGGGDDNLIAATAVAGDQITFLPKADQSGSTTVQITRTNDVGLTAVQDVVLTWTPIDDLPVIAGLPTSFNTTEDAALQFAVGSYISDKDTDVSTFQWSIEGYKPELVASASVSGSEFVLTPVPDASGQTDALIKVVDPASGAALEQAVSLEWTAVNDPPQTPVIGKPSDGQVEVPLSAVLSWSVVDVDGDALSYDVFFGPEGSAVQVAAGQAASSYSAVGMQPGTAYSWRVVVRDPSGESAEASARFTTEVDRVPPRISGLTATAVDLGARIVWSTDEAARFELSYAGESTEANPLPDVGQVSDAALLKNFEVALPQLQGATWYDFSVVVIDREGNASEPVSGRFRTLAAPDVDPPVIQPGSVQVNGIVEDGAWVRWETDELSTSAVSYAAVGGPVAKVAQENSATGGLVESTVLTRSHAVQLSGLSADTSKNVSIGADAAFRTAAGADLVPPQFMLAPGAQAQVEQAEIAFAADEVVTAEIRYDVDDSPEDGRVILSTVASEYHVVALDALEPATAYSFQVAITDLGGNTTQSSVRTFETRAAPDVTPPLAEGWRVVPSSERAMLEFVFDEPVVATVAWWPVEDPDNISFVDLTELAPRHGISMGNLQASTVFAYEIDAVDMAGNSAALIADQFETEAAPDIAPPIVLNALVDAQRLENVALRVDLDEAALLQVDLTLTSIPEEAETSAEVGSSRRLVGADVQESHRVALTSLVPGAAYGVSFTATDPYGNAQEGALAFNAPLRPDTEPPQLLSLPVALNVSEGGARIGVGYNEDVQLSVRYYPTEDPSLAETRSFSQPQREHAFELNGLASGTAYTIDLEARDGADLTNASALNVITLIEADIDPPVFTKLPWVENADLTSVRLGMELDEPVVAQLTMTNVEDETEKHRLSVVDRAKGHVLEMTGLISGAAYAYAVLVKDANGNETVHSGQVSTVKEVLPPSIVEGPTRQRITEDRVWIFFKTNVPTRAEISYYPEDTPADVQVEKPSGRGKAHVVQLTNL